MTRGALAVDPMVEIVLSNRPEERRKLLTGLEAFAEERKLPAAVFNAADLALEEHVTNVIRYAYENGGPGEIVVKLEVEDSFLVVEVIDDGKPFNPLNRPPVDTTVPLESKPVGGLGIHLIRRFMDEVQYSRDGNKNILRMRKRVEPAPTGS